MIASSLFPTRFFLEHPSCQNWLRIWRPMRRWPRRDPRPVKGAVSKSQNPSFIGSTPVCIPAIGWIILYPKNLWLHCCFPAILTALPVSPRAIENLEKAIEVLEAEHQCCEVVKADVSGLPKTNPQSAQPFLGFGVSVFCHTSSAFSITISGNNIPLIKKYFDACWLTVYDIGYLMWWKENSLFDTPGWSRRLMPKSWRLPKRTLVES